MQTRPDEQTLRTIHARMQSVAGRLRLPFRSRTWRGQSGNWLGAGLGSSIDFQDHRPYLPGDDPRYIDWQAYARTGHYTMKLYREEVRPLVDLVFDASESMFFDPEKTGCSLELLYFCAESALQSGASLRCFLVRGDKVAHLPVEQLLDHSLFNTQSAAIDNGRPAPLHATQPRLEQIPWRQGSLRVLISDLLYGGAPESLLMPLGISKGRGLIFCPFCKAESDPDWLGNVELIDCEMETRRNQRVESDLLARYKMTYARHFALWREQSIRYAALIARIPCGVEFSEALQLEAFGLGAVEMR